MIDGPSDTEPNDPLSAYGPPAYGLPAGLPESAAVPAGWYQDPLTARHRRWWDGTRWTESIEGARESWRSLWPSMSPAVLAVGAAALAGIPVVSAYLAEARADARMDVGGAGFYEAFDAFEDASRRLVSAYRTALLAQAVAGAVFLVWFARAHRAANDIRGVRFPRWTVWGWLVPFVNLYRPKQMVNDVWMAGDPRLDREITPVRIGVAVQAWWVLWLLWAACAALAPVMGVLGPANLGDQLVAAQFSCALLAGVAAIVWTVQATRRLEARQRARSRPV